MANKKTHSDKTGSLRQHAEKQLQANASEAEFSRADVETLRLLHELQVHQIELEMQNAELRKSQDDLGIAQTRYQLAESQSLFKGIIDSTTDLIWSVDSESFGLRSFNRSFSDYFLEVRNIQIECGMRAEDILPREYVQLWHDFYRRALEKGSFSTEYVTHSSLKTLLLNFNPLKVDETVFGVSVFARDITKHKRAEDALKKSELQYRTILHTLLDGFWVVDMQGRFIDVNESYCTIIGYTRNELLGMSIQDVESLENKADIENHIQKIIAAGSHRIESQHRRKDGHTVDLDICVSWLPESAGLCASLRDISERKRSEVLLRKAHDELEIRVAERTAELAHAMEQIRESEERHQLATAVAKEAIWEVDFCSGTTKWNRAYAELFNRPPDEHHHGEWWLQQIHPDDRERVNDKFSRAVVEGPDEWSDAYRMVKADGSYAFLQDRAIIVRDKTGKALRAVGAKQDISVLKQAETALMESEQRVRMKLDSILAPEGSLDVLELSDIIDIQALQLLMDDFYRITRFPLGIHNINGETLIATGWQEICTKFHRVHPESRKQCEESDVALTADIQPGEFRLHKCMSNLWDVATPLIVGGRKFGNIFSGQFFFEGEDVDYDLFRAQAQRYGFDEEAYIAALEKVPRISRETMNAGMTYYVHLAEMISKLSYSNIKLARTLSERSTLTKSLRESEERLRFALENSHTGAWEINLVDHTAFHSLEHARIFGYSEVLPNWTFNMFLEHVLPEEREIVKNKVQQAIEDRNNWNFECRIRRTDGEIRWISAAGRHLYNAEGAALRSAGIVQDVTARKKIEDEILRLNTELEKRVAARTADLAQANEQLRREIADRLETEKALRVSNEEWLNTFNASSDPIFLLDTNHHIMRANKATAALAGLPIGDVLGRLCHEIIHGTAAPIAPCPQCRLHEDGQSHSAEVFVEHLGIYLLVTVSPIFDATNTHIGSIHYSKDITSIKEAENVLANAKIDLERKVDERTAELAEAHEKMKKVSFELIWAEEKERERIAAELHDQVGQSLLLAKMKLDALEDELSDDSLYARAMDASTLIDTSIQDIRSLTFRMRPPLLDTAGIGTSLEWLCSSISNDYNLRVDFADDCHPKPLSAEMRYSLYQAVRELLLNVVKHAGTETAQLSITAENQTLVVNVADNGVGFKHPDAMMKHVNNGGYGLYNVRQRIEQMGGRFTVESAPGKGTSVTLQVPFY